MSNQLHLIYGDERLLVEEKISAFKRSVADPSLDLEILEGEISPAVLSSALQTQTLLGGDKVVIIRDIEISPENQADLIAPLRDLPPGVTAVFHFSAIDKRMKFFKFLAERAEVTECRSFAPWETDQLAEWITERGKKLGKKISSPAADLLIEVCGTDLAFLANELDKLATYVGESGEITPADVKAAASQGEVNVFALVDALRHKDLTLALTLFQNLLYNRVELLPLLGLLRTQYRLMFQIKALPGRDRNPYSVAKAIGASQFNVRKCLETIDRFSLDELKNNIIVLLDTNLKLKSGASQAVVFEILLTTLCGA
ncbi:MAG: DNA polymerase III subunit delta [Candidatus Margulisbacteria bacterium]|nr:DNA polymerase III subunit delta [Candidatus Margulisiibacteriota bacterium]MBU1616908.1 DNA polymerase III subunit delta [Candidatus Margulisiibacteriota bacterium]